MKPDFPSPEVYEHPAWVLMCESRVLRAIAKVESGPYGAFLDSGEPVILYERHVFHEQTLIPGTNKSRFEGARADVAGITDFESLILCHPSPSIHHYGPSSLQHIKLNWAVKLDREAALKSCSWGLFQIMGYHHVRCGYKDIQRFVTAMYRSADDHLRALTSFIRSDPELLDAIREKDFPRIALIYNGPGYRQNKWDEKIKQAYEELA